MFELLTTLCYSLIFLALLLAFLKIELGWFAGPISSVVVMMLIGVTVEASYSWIITGSLGPVPPHQGRPLLRLSFILIALAISSIPLVYITFFRKAEDPNGPPSFHEKSEYLEFLEKIGHFTYPEWDKITDRIYSNSNEDQFDEKFNQAARAWASKIKDELHYNTPIFETQNFIIVAPFTKSEATRAGRFYEQSRSNIFKHLPGVAATEGFGKHVIFITTNEEDYYEYISPFYPDGDNSTSGGICVTGGGYVHMVIPISEYNDGRNVIVHELTHCCLSHLPLPTWIDEALAMRMESALVRPQYFELEDGIFDKHQRFWNEETIQHFWSGKSWESSGDNFSLSYHLAQVLWRKIEKDIEAPGHAILNFAAAAHFEDAGQDSCQKHLGLNLADLVEDFLGEGNWAPKPDTWPHLPDTIPDLLENLLVESEVP